MFDKFWAYFIESDHSYAKRFLMFCGIVTSILCADYFFRFSDSYITEKKLDQISKIQEILKTDSLRAEPKRELYRLESEILNRQGFWAFSSSCISFLRSTISSQIKYIAKNKKTNPIDNSVKIVENNTRSIYWHIITSCWFLIVMMFLVPYSFITADSKIPNAFAAFFTVEVILALLCVLVSYIFGLIPAFKYPALNYLLNIFIWFIPIGLINFYKKK